MRTSLIICLLLGACATGAPLTRADRVSAYCSKQGPDLAIAQCAQFYAIETSVEPPSPARTGMNASAIAAILGGFTQGAQAAQVNYQPTYQAHAYRPMEPVYVPPVTTFEPNYVSNPSRPGPQFVPYTAVSSFMPGIGPNGTAH